MKTIIKKLTLVGERFALVQETKWGKDHQYGTIPYSEIDERGNLRRELNGFEMCVAATSQKAIESRRDSLIVRKWCDEHPDATEEEKTAAALKIVGIKF
nr:MAG TPA: hypothetical protein [Caudoviricetes sp.]